MSVQRQISTQIIQAEIEECLEDCKEYGWDISPIDTEAMTFRVKLKAIDGELFELQVKYDNYKEIPLLIDFVDPHTGQLGTKKSYPLTKKGFFHTKGPTICHPASRKAYRGFQGLHNEWELIGWQKNPNIGTLTNLRAILEAIHFRINDPEIYVKRMG